MKSVGFDDVASSLPVAGLERLPTLTRRKKESLRASAESIGKNGLRAGVIVSYETRLYVVKSVDPQGMDLLILNGPLRLTRKLPVVAVNGRGCHASLVAVEYLPQRGFVHMRSVTYASKSILAEDNAMVLRKLQKELGQKDRYEHAVFGTFWREAKVAAFKKRLWHQSQTRAAP